MAFDWYIQEEINHWSPEQEALFGLPPGTFDGTYKSWKSMMYAPDWPMVVEAIQHAHQTGVVEAEYRVVWPDGSLHWLSTNGRMFFDDAGEPLRMVGFTSDVSRRKMAEVQLAGEKHLLEMVATGRPLAEILASLCSYVEDIAPDCYCGVYLIDWDGPKVRLAVGPTLPAGFNAALDGIYFTPETGPCAMAAYERTQVIAADVETDELWRSSPFRTLALDYRLKSCWSTPIYSRSGEVLGTFAIYQNKAGTPTPLQQDLIAQVTHIASIAIERSQHEEALRRSEAFLAEGQYLARIGSFAWNAATDKITWSEQLYRMYEFEPGLPITPEVVRTRVHPDDVSLYEKMKEHQLIGRGDFEWQYRLLMPDKSIKHLHAIAHASRNHQGEPEYIAAVQDVTARRASEEALRLSEAELRRANQYLTIAQELSHTGSYARDVSTDEQTLSDEMYRIWDFDPSQKVTQDMVVARVHPEDRPLFEKGWQRALEEGEDIEAPAYRIVTGSGTVKHLRSFSRRVEEITDRLVYVGATQDVTEKKLAEEALDQARSELARVSRVTTFGALTASIAHEVNQPLSGIITNASTCQRMLAAEPPNIEGAIETARRIIRDGNRASDVITRLRSLFGKREVMAESVNLNDVVEEIITLSRRELEANQVLLKQDLSDDLPIVIGDRVQLQQVILNLLLNASHAMEDIEDRPRELVIGTRQEENGVLLTVKDIGVGFDPQNEDKLFNAFYTTKKSGMGIGLHVSRSIIESHRGRLWATVNDGPGATFSFTIPRAA
jgi:PAS domain S-box-containing protein